jgi:membrane protein implicated in regulation of membrane protease activity
VWIAALVVLAAELLATAWLVFLVSRGTIVVTFDKGADLATLVLTAAILVVTGVAVMVAIVTVWGFREIRDRAVGAAVGAALNAVRGQVRQAYAAGEASPEGGDADRIATEIEDDTQLDGPRS